MKTLLLFLGLSLTPALAEPPSQPSRARYQKLANDSPFTTKPEVTAGPPPESPIDDWALGGITKFKDGYYALLIDKKDPTKREIVGKGDLASWKVEKVTYSKDGWRGTTVRVNSGRFSGDVEFDDKLVAVKAQAPPQPQQQQQGRPNVPGQPNAGDRGGRTPRPRVVVPPPQGGNTNARGGNTSQRGNSSQQGSSQRNQRFSRGRGR